MDFIETKPCIEATGLPLALLRQDHVLKLLACPWHRDKIGELVKQLVCFLLH
jgi:hypothetical protein